MPDSPTTGRHIDAIEITRDMIEAGARAVDPYDEPFLNDHEKAELIFRAMLGVALRDDCDGNVDAVV